MKLPNWIARVLENWRIDRRRRYAMKHVFAMKMTLADAGDYVFERGKWAKGQVFVLEMDEHVDLEVMTDIRKMWDSYWEEGKAPKLLILEPDARLSVAEVAPSS